MRETIDPFPTWLPVLRDSGYRLQGVPFDQRAKIEADLKRRGIQLPKPGRVWPSTQRMIPQ